MCENKSLQSWVRTQRATADNLSEERKDKLDSIGFLWDTFAPSKRQRTFKGRSYKYWEEGFGYLVEFKKMYGHVKVEEKFVLENFPLGSWVSAQRRGKLELEATRKQQLEALGFVWDVLSEQWEQAFACLVIFKEQNGHCLVPARLVYNGFKLGPWVRQQRTVYAQGKMSTERKVRLDAIGFHWKVVRSKT